MSNVSNINVHSFDYDIKDSLAREHIADKGNPHEVTAEQLGLGALQGRTPENILEELTKEEIVNALQYAPANSSVEEDVNILQDKVKELQEESKKDPFSDLDIKIGLEVTNDGTLNVINQGSIHFQKDGAVTRAEINKLNDQVRELFQFVSDVREKLAAAITDRGVYTRSDASFDEIINNIYQIEGNSEILKTTLNPVTNMLSYLPKGTSLPVSPIMPVKIFTTTAFEEYAGGGE